MEKNLQGKIVAKCKKHAILCYKVESKSIVGFPDLYLAGRGRHELWECKHPGKTGRLRPGQVRRIAELRAAGIRVRVIDSYDEAEKLIDNWGSYRVTREEH